MEIAVVGPYLDYRVLASNYVYMPGHPGQHAQIGRSLK
jgi:hypothetical protein